MKTLSIDKLKRYAVDHWDTAITILFIVGLVAYALYCAVTYGTHIYFETI